METKTMYRVRENGTYSHIQTIEVEPEFVTISDWDNESKYYQGIEVFDTFTDAKKYLINYISMNLEAWKWAMKDARKLRKSDIK